MPVKSCHLQKEKNVMCIVYSSTRDWQWSAQRHCNSSHLNWDNVIQVWSKALHDVPFTCRSRAAGDEASLREEQRLETPAAEESGSPHKHSGLGWWSTGPWGTSLFPRSLWRKGLEDHQSASPFESFRTFGLILCLMPEGVHLLLWGIIVYV